MRAPPKFPRRADIALVAGVHPKLAVIRDASSGNYVAQRDSDATGERFAICEDLAEQLASKCARSRDGKYRHLSEREILDQLLKRLLTSGRDNRDDVDSKPNCREARMALQHGRRPVNQFMDRLMGYCLLCWICRRPLFVSPPRLSDILAMAWRGDNSFELYLKSAGFEFEPDDASAGNSRQRKFSELVPFERDAGPPKIPHLRVGKIKRTVKQDGKI